MSQRERDVAEIDRIIAEIDHGTHVATVVPIPNSRARIIARGEGPMYSFRDAAARRYVELARAGDSVARIFVDGKPYAPSSGELRKAGAEKLEIRSWIGEGSNMAKKQKKAAKKVKSAKGASKKSGEKKVKSSGIGALVFSLLKKNPNLTVDEFVKRVKADFPDWTPKPGHLRWYRWKAVKDGIIKKASINKSKAKKAKKAKRKKK
jgi:hypothetical protein